MNSKPPFEKGVDAEGGRGFVSPSQNRCAIERKKDTGFPPKTRGNDGVSGSPRPLAGEGRGRGRWIHAKAQKHFVGAGLCACPWARTP
jgi:hypothetical protein